MEKTPQEEKKKMALFLSGVITFFVFLGWIFIFVGDAKKELDQTAAGRVALFSVFEDNIGKFSDKFVNQFKSLPEKFMATTDSGQLKVDSGQATDTSTSTQTNFENQNLTGQAIGN